MLGVCPCEGRITAEAGLEAAVGSRDALTDEVAGMKQTAFLQIVMDGTSRFLFEQAHHVEFADEKFICQQINGKIRMKKKLQKKKRKTPFP